LKSLRSALIERNTPPPFQNGPVWPRAALKSVSPVHAKWTVAFRVRRGAVTNVPTSLRRPARTKRYQ